jgi:hypothetical protein
MRQQLSCRVTLVALFASVLMIACGGEKTTEPPPIPLEPTSVQLSASTVSLRMGESSQLTANVLDQHGAPMVGQTITWSSSDTTRITVTSTGTTRGVRPGTATITASSGTLTKSATGTVLAPQLIVDAGASVTKSIGVAGGTISTQAINGSQFTLTVPPTALSGTVDVTLTPITTIQNLPTGTTVVAAVRMRPDGLTFLAPASLTIATATAPSTTNLVGLRFNDDGSALHMTPIARSGTQLTIPISHFSGAGAANITSPPLIPLNGSGTIAGEAQSQLMLQEVNAQATGNYDVAAITAILITWYTTGVKPVLQNGATDETLLNGAISGWAEWVNTIAAFPPSIAGALDAATATQQAEARSLAATAFQAAIQRNNAACMAQLDLSAAGKVLLWQRVAQYHALATAANALDQSTVLNGLCVKVGYGQISLPDTLLPMQSVNLRVQAGLRFGPGPLLFSANPSVDVGVMATGSTDGAMRHHQTDATGVAQTAVTPTGAGPLSVALHSCINDTAGGIEAIVGLTLFDVCRDTTLTRTVDSSRVVYENDFNGAVGTEWSRQNVTQSPGQPSQRFLGLFQLGSVVLSLSNVPTHTSVTIEFDFHTIHDWEGNAPPSTGGTDIMSFLVDGQSLLRTTFSTKPGFPQAYPGTYPNASNSPMTGAAAIGSLGYPNGTGHRGDATYRLSFSLPHTTSGIQFTIRKDTEGESWGIDNIRVTVR